jgi:hypothetical protein
MRNSPSEQVSCRWQPVGNPIEARLTTHRETRFGAARYSCAVVVFEQGSQPMPENFHAERQTRAFVPPWCRHNLLDWMDRQRDWPPDEYIVQGADARGWPLQSLWCAYTWNPVTEPDLWFWELHGGGIELGNGAMPSDPADWWPRVALPCLPIWGGLAGDTIIYAVMWRLLLAAPGRILARRRRRRGECVACAYDLRGLGSDAACPECGAVPITRICRVTEKRRDRSHQTASAWRYT